jgi:NAD(P)-dependent dehydrogenase (short-subunit alcohol dehydrogenase family)
MNMVRTVLVTGANSGIGLATVIELARRGFDAVGSVRTTAKAKQVRQAASEAGVAVRTALLDVTDAGACVRLIDRLRPYGIVNNAGYSAIGAIEDVDDAEAHRVVETMVFGPIRLARAALPTMREAGGGRIVNLSSIYGLATTPLTGWYQACKHALEALSDALRVEVARDGIRVVLIEPGGFRTGIWDEAAGDTRRREGSRYGEAYRRIGSGVRMTQPLMGDPSAVARAIAGAMTSRSPRPRYLVGYDARAIAFWDSILPTEVKDRLARLSLRL